MKRADQESKKQIKFKPIRTAISLSTSGSHLIYHILFRSLYNLFR